MKTDIKALIYVDIYMEKHLLTGSKRYLVSKQQAQDIP